MQHAVALVNAVLQAPDGYELSAVNSHPAQHSACPPSSYPPSAYAPPAPYAASPPYHPAAYPAAAYPPPQANSPAAPAYSHSPAPAYPPSTYALPSVAELLAQQAEVQRQIAEFTQRNALLRQQLGLSATAAPCPTPTHGAPPPG